MKNQQLLNKLIETNYKKWLKLSKIICTHKNIKADDVLHELIIKILEKDVDVEKLTDSYIFISLRNTFLIEIKNYNKLNNIVYQEQEDNVIEELYENDKELQDKLDKLSIKVMKLNVFERKLYQLHFIHGISQREISRNINVSHLTIWKKIQKIKEKIK